MKHSGLIWREDTGYEWRCSACRSHWPLDDALTWPSHYGLARCAACVIGGRRARDRVPALRRTEVGFELLCGVCATFVPLEGYYRGRYGRCRACLRRDGAEYRRTHPDTPARKAAKRAYLEMLRRYHPELANRYNRAWRENHPDRARETRLRYYATHREQRQAKGRENYARHAEKRRAAARRYYANMTPEQREHRREMVRQRKAAAA